MRTKPTNSFFNKAILLQAAKDSFRKLNPVSLVKNPVIFIVAIGSLLTTIGVLIPLLAIAGNLAKKKITPPSTGTFHTDNWLFMGLLIAVILIVGGLTFFPALSFGPIIEHLLMNQGIIF